MFGLPACVSVPPIYVCVSVQIEFDLLKFDIFRDTSAANQANMSKKTCTEKRVYLLLAKITNKCCPKPYKKYRFQLWKFLNMHLIHLSCTSLWVKNENLNNFLHSANKRTETINIGRKVDWKATQLHIWWLDGYYRWLCGMRATWHTFTNCLSPLPKRKNYANVFVFRLLHILFELG